jgi:hypothetical protein
MTSGLKWSYNCSLCQSNDQRMTIQYGKCRDPLCSVDCPVKVRKRKCFSTGLIEWATANDHVGGSIRNQSRRLPAVLVNFVKERLEFKPSVIKNLFEAAHRTEPKPSIKCIRNLRQRLLKEHLGNAESELKQLFRDFSHNSEATACSPYCFGPSVNAVDIRVGRFLVGVTSMGLLDNLRTALLQRPQILHFDGTYGLNFLRFPLVLVGVSDAMGRFHLVAIYVTESEDNEAYKTMLEHLKAESIAKLQRDYLQPSYVMTDGARGFPSLVSSVFPAAVHLMCYFHLTQACKKKCPQQSWSMVLMDLQKMHYTSSLTEYINRRNEAFTRWTIQCPEFQSYFVDSWDLGTQYGKWQVFQTPCGFALTNNPSEIANLDLKRTYMVRRRCGLVTCLRGMINYARSKGEALTERNFEHRPNLELLNPSKLRKWDSKIESFGFANVGMNYSVSRDGVDYVSSRDECFCMKFRKFGYCIHHYACRRKFLGYIPPHLRTLDDRRRAR